MSHFTVLVLTKPNGKTVDELLAPYNECIEVAPYVDKTKEEMIAKAKERKERYLKEKSEGKELADWQLPYINAETDEDFYKCEWYSDEDYDTNGNHLTTYNPNSKWDWYQIGGRWAGLLKANKGNNGSPSFMFGADFDYGNGHYDSALISDLDFENDIESYNEAIRFWEVVVDGDDIKEDEDKRQFDNWYSKEWYIDTYHNKETYAKCCASFGTYAVITPDGVWHEEGQMGWWGMSSETPEEALDWELHYKERFIDTAEPNWTATIVDCHI